MLKAGGRWQEKFQADPVSKAIATFLHRTQRGKDIALWSKEGTYLGHYEWSTAMHFPITASPNGRVFETVVV